MSRVYTVLIFICSCLLSWWVGSRQEFVLALGIFSVAFIAYYYLAYKSEFKLANPWFWAVAVRLPFLLTLPSLSDDFYRFIWDGSLQWDGINPFLFTPEQAIKEFPRIDSLNIYTSLNSPSYFSVYPAFNQFLFAISAKLGGSTLDGQVIALRCVILFGEFLVLFLLQKLGSSLKKPNLFWLYAFNPLVILEFTGNLHFEVWFIAFLLSAYYVYQVLGNKILVPAILFGLAISTKLLPALFLPLIWKHLGLKKGLVFCLIAMSTFSITFLPYFNTQIVLNIYESVDLFVRTFEFNASIYYVLRWIGFKVVGYNWIGTIGLLLKGITTIIILIVSVKGKSFLKSALIIYLAYLLLSTTIHPWYILPVFVLSIFSDFRSVLLWTGLVFLSYHAYRLENYNELLWVVSIEYVLLIILLWRERSEMLQTFLSKK